jgi:hypothetical protein
MKLADEETPAILAAARQMVTFTFDRCDAVIDIRLRFVWYPRFARLAKRSAFCETRLLNRDRRDDARSQCISGAGDLATFTAT